MNEIKASFTQKAINAVKENPFGYFVLGLIILWIAYWAVTTYIGPTRPGAFLQRSKYEKNIYVLVYPGKTVTKNYYLPGDVSRGENGYTISSVTWPDGGYSTFDDCQIYLDHRTECLITNSSKFNKLDLNDPNYIKELQDLPTYYIQLTNNVVK